MKKLIIVFVALCLGNIIIFSQNIQQKTIIVDSEYYCNFENYTQIYNDTSEDISEYNSITSFNDIIRIENEKHEKLNYTLISKNDYYLLNVKLDKIIHPGQEFIIYIYTRNNLFIKEFGNGYRFSYNHMPIEKTIFKLKIVFQKVINIKNSDSLDVTVTQIDDKTIVEKTWDLGEVEVADLTFDFN